MEFFDLRNDPGAGEDLGRDHSEASDYTALEQSLVLRETGDHELDAEAVEALRSLGYLL